MSDQPSSIGGCKPPVSGGSSAVTWASDERTDVAEVVREGADANNITSSNQVITNRHGVTATEAFLEAVVNVKGGMVSFAYNEGLICHDTFTDRQHHIRLIEHPCGAPIEVVEHAQFPGQCLITEVERTVQT